MYGLVANVVSDHVMRTGAKVYIIRTHGDAKNCEVHGLNKSGRKVEKHMAWKRLTNIRPAWLPFHISRMVSLWWPDKDSANKIAQELTTLWEGVRFFNPDGRLLKDGISSGQAFKKRLDRDKNPFIEVSDIRSIEDRYKEIRTERGNSYKTATPDGWSLGCGPIQPPTV